MTAPSGVIEVPLRRKVLIGYGGLAVPLILAEIPVLTFLPAFYAKDRGLSVGLVGTVFLFARIWDGLLDLLIGWLSDKTRSRYGRRKPWIVAGAPCLMLAAWFLCNPPPGAGLGYMCLWVILFYSAYTVVKIPYWSWGAELASGYEQRSRVTGFRETGTMIGVLLFSIVPMLALADAPPLGDVLSLIALGIILLIPPTVLGLVLFVAEAPSAGKADGGGFGYTLRSVTRNRPMILFLIASTMIYMSIGALNALIVFLIDIGLRLPGWIFVLTLVQYIAALAGTPLIAYLGKRIDKHDLLAGGVLLQITALTLAAVAPVAGNLPLTLVLFAMLGLALSAVLVIPLSIIADIADHGALESRDNLSGSYVAAFNLSTKLGAAVGLGLAFWLIDLIGFNPAAAQQSNADTVALRLAGFGLAALLLAPAVVFLLRFPLTRAVQQAMRARGQYAAETTGID